MIKSILKQTGHFDSFDGTDIFYEVRGEGEPIIFCYGIACLFNHWIHQTTFFSERYKTVMFDYRGHHKSEIPENKKNLSIEAIGKDLVALVDHLGYEKATFVGHSFGCQVLMAAYKERPEMFKKMVFINGLYQNPFETVLEKAAVIEAINRVKVAYNQAPQVFSFFWEKGVTNPLLVPISSIMGGFNLSATRLKDIEIYARGVAAIDIRVFITLFEDMVRFNEREFLPKIETPTLIICGSKDALTPLEEQRIMERLIPESELFIVPYGSHCTQLDFPEMVNLKIQQFLENKD